MPYTWYIRYNDICGINGITVSCYLKQSINSTFNLLFLETVYQWQSNFTINKTRYQRKKLKFFNIIFSNQQFNKVFDTYFDTYINMSNSSTRSRYFSDK